MPLCEEKQNGDLLLQSKFKGESCLVRTQYYEEPERHTEEFLSDTIHFIYLRKFLEVIKPKYRKVLTGPSQH